MTDYMEQCLIVIERLDKRTEDQLLACPQQKAMEVEHYKAPRIEK